MNLERLLQIIKEAEEEEWKELDLSNQDLEFLPAEIEKLTRLKNLFLEKLGDRQKSVLNIQF